MRAFRDPDLARQFGWILAAASMVAWVVGLVLFVSSGARFRDSFMLQNVALSLALALAFVAMVRKEPHNGAVWTLGWAMVLLAFGQVLNNGVIDTALVGLVGEPRGPMYRVPATYGELPLWLNWLQLLQEYTWIFAWFSLATISLLLFPDGRLVSPRWWWAIAAAIAGMLTLTVPFLVAWRPSARAEMMVGDFRYTTALEVADAVGLMLLVGAFLAALVSLALRHRRASGEGRHQIRWVAMGGLAVMLAHLLWVLAFVDLDLAERIVRGAVLACIPVVVGSYAVAILRYRLYDIDVVISRSLVAAALAGFIAAVYVAIVVGLGTVIGVRDDPALGLQVVATAIVAVAFQPLRQRLRRWADRVVYGHRATPYEVLAGFSRQAASAGDLASLQGVAEVLAAGTGAAPAVVWLRVGQQIRPVASGGDRGGVDLVALPLDGDDLPALPASLVVPVRHDDELLGAVSLTKPRREPLSRQDEELASRLARGLALMLRNARLTTELREQLEVLQASGARLVRAQDDARRAIEGDLRAGAQHHLQQLQALLGRAQGRAAAAGADRTAALLAQLEQEACGAVETLQALAQGIYPPLLEAEGLGVAMSAQAARAPLPVTVHATGLPRYARDVEVAVYFSLLEVLQNAVKYARASSVHVRIEQRDDGLWFEVSDDGVGFDPQHTGHGSGLIGIAARLDTIDGAIEVQSRPGFGTRVVGHIPTAPSQPAVTGPPALEVAT